MLHFGFQFLCLTYLFPLPPVGLCCHKRYSIMMFLSYDLWKVFGIVFKFLVFCMVRIHTFCNRICDVSKMVVPTRTYPNETQRMIYFADLADIFWLLIIWKYRKHNNRCFVKSHCKYVWIHLVTSIIIRSPLIWFDFFWKGVEGLTLSGPLSSGYRYCALGGPDKRGGTVHVVNIFRL